jgi:hypothetical protein
MLKRYRTLPLSPNGPVRSFVASYTTSANHIVSDNGGAIHILSFDGQLSNVLQDDNGVVTSLIVVRDDDSDGPEVIIGGNTLGEIKVYSITDG